MKELCIQEISSDIRNVISTAPDVIKAIGIFGSVARGESSSDSDIDLLVEYNSPPVFEMELYTSFCRLCNQLEDVLTKTYERKVDIVHIENGSLDNLYDKSVENEVIWL